VEPGFADAIAKRKAWDAYFDSAMQGHEMLYVPSSGRVVPTCVDLC
jgi:hypothetical protein